MNAPSIPRSPFAIQSAEMDFLTLVEAEIRPPIAFKTLEGLKRWVGRNGLEIIRIGKRKLTDACVVHGTVNSLSGDFYYTQIWVRASYQHYRKALKAYIHKTDGPDVTIDNHDVDHAVSSTFLERHWQDAWVNVLFVERGINRSIGALMEKKLKPPTGDVINLNIESVLKIFYRRMDKLKGDNIKNYFAEAANRFLSKINTIEDIAAVMNATEILNDIAGEFDPSFIVRRDFIRIAINR